MPHHGGVYATYIISSFLPAMQFRTYPALELDDAFSLFQRHF